MVSLQYRFTLTHSHTHTEASISSTLLFYEGQFRVQHLAQGHFGMQMGKTGDRTADLQVGGRALYPSATARPLTKGLTKNGSISIWLSLIKCYFLYLSFCSCC